MIFSEKLQLLRKSKGYTQEELAQRLNVSRQAVAKWETGQVYPDITNLIQISNFSWFQGYEEIYWKDERIYECYFHGGLMR